MDEFRILKGLPGAGPWPEQFSEPGGSTHNEGFVVEFLPAMKPPWVGNFQLGFGTYSGVLRFPDGGPYVVIAGGQGYVIEFNEKQLLRRLGGGICSVVSVPQLSLLIFGSPWNIEAWDANFMHWRSRRVSLDGIRNLRVERGWLKGMACALGDSEVPFEVNLETGEAFGGYIDENSG
jgi:hypothetical protein